MRGTAYESHLDLKRDFVHGKLTRVRSGGGSIDTWPAYGSLTAILGNAQAITLEIAQARRTNVSHRVIVEDPSAPYARAGDRFVLDSPGTGKRYFYITHVEDPGDLGRVVLYSVWEDTDRGQPA